MMIKKIYVLLFISFIIKTNAQQQIISDFNNDGINDTLSYTFLRVGDFDGLEEILEPTCKLKLFLGNLDKTYFFNLYYAGNTPIIGSNRNGNIYLYDWTKDTDYLQEYDYSKKHDDWILTKNKELLKYENDKEVNTLPKKYLLGISDKEYVINKKKKNLKETRKKKPKSNK